MRGSILASSVMLMQRSNDVIVSLVSPRSMLNFLCRVLYPSLMLLKNTSRNVVSDKPWTSDYRDREPKAVFPVEAVKIGVFREIFAEADRFTGLIVFGDCLMTFEECTFSQVVTQLNT